jgi:hypothetical protein
VSSARSVPNHQRSHIQSRKADRAEQSILSRVASEYGDDMAEMEDRFIHAPDQHTYEQRHGASRRQFDNLGVRSDNWPPQGHVYFRANEPQ